ncbi:putative tricarboxylic transport membrane protein [Xaviernesmea oryzae]|uniref:Putative tricarboxylic transport membrane protein n=1 Tax=Xaviernesmea oryzae TaxID=464029 RepID=A0A1X7FP56_9HYPH|nr:tripartite tricarboxylate transporter permease [Xaviernesmea oryzae]SMF56065.1 putative tricarboxylic transport membrane protein [Xaviernesmea oryzae]
MFEALGTGLLHAAEPQNLLWALWGCILGNLVGVLPGLGSAGAIAILVPITAVLPPVPGLIMLCAIFYGSNYGGTISTVLLNIPGEASSAITAMDGHPMAMEGRAGAALSVAAIGSFIGGVCGTLALAFGAPVLAQIGLLMGPVERFAMMIFALALITGLLGDRMVIGLVMAALGLLVGTIGIDPTLGIPRFTFGSVDLLDGVNFVAAVMGLFGISEILLNTEQRLTGKIADNVGRILPTRGELRQSWGPIWRGTGIGMLLGMIPGATSVVASFLSYSTETAVSKTPERFGKGAIEGVAGPETANNAFANSNFIPLFALGIPGTASLAILAGGMMMNGLTPGPFLFRDNPDVVWTVIASMFVGNVMLLALNVPLISVWVQLLRIRYSLLAPIIAVLTLVGSYALTENAAIVWVTIVFGVLGYFFRKLDMPIAPMVLTMIVGPGIESNLRRSLQASNGDFAVLFQSHIAVVLFLASIVLIVWSVWRTAHKHGEQRVLEMRESD